MNEDLNALLQFLEQNKAKSISLFDLQNEKCDQDFVVLANFDSALENKAFAEKLMAAAAFEDYPEGYNRGEWIVFDLGKILLHTFIPLKREKYNLDKLYQSFKVVLKSGKTRGKK